MFTTQGAQSTDGLTRVDASTTAHDIAALLAQDGGVVVQNFLSIAQVGNINQELDPHINKRNPGFRHHGDESFYGGNTKRIQGLAAKSKSFVESILLHKLLLGVADEILLKNCGDYWMSQAETIFIGPGNKAQALHKDDINWSHAGRLGIDLQLSALVALGDYDAEVGATMIVPGSHLLPSDSTFDKSLARPVEMEVGDALFYTGALVHGGGANTTPDRWRKALYIGLLLGWLTPEEAVARSITPEVAEELPQRARELLGWANIHGNAEAEGVHADVQLWQLDSDDLQKFSGIFIDR